jgi:hypothetical protein
LTQVKEALARWALNGGKRDLPAGRMVAVRGPIMAEQGTPDPSAGDPEHQTEREEERIPAMQRLMDNPFLLLFLGVTIPAAFYVIWGVMEIVSIPIAK